MVVDVGAGLAPPLLLAISSCSAISAAGERSLVTGKTTAAAVVGVFHRRCRLRWLTESLPESLWLLRKRFGAEVLVAGILIVDFGSRRKGLGDAFELWNCVLRNEKRFSWDPNRVAKVQVLGEVMDMDHDYDQVYDEYNSSWGCATEGQSNGQRFGKKLVHDKCPPTFKSNRACGDRKIGRITHRSSPARCLGPSPPLFLVRGKRSSPLFLCDSGSVGLSPVHMLYDRLGFNLLRFFDPISALNMAISEPTAGEFFPEKKNVRNPLVPVGAFITAGVLTAGLISFRRGNSHLGQKLMRARVVVQGATVALMVGTAYYYGDNPWQSDHKKEKI
ncbi:RING-H2 finger protein [Arachis hypogaea]|nr:RING-H2 finger protein [Arachis hypogaea]